MIILPIDIYSYIYLVGKYLSTNLSKVNSCQKKIFQFSNKKSVKIFELHIQVEILPRRTKPPHQRTHQHCQPALTNPNSKTTSSLTMQPKRGGDLLTAVLDFRRVFIPI